jgi:arginine N-succinyltransferase
MHCEVDQIRAVRESASGTVQRIEDSFPNASQQLISNAKLNFRTCLGITAWDQDAVTIDQITALRLNLKIGDRVRCINLKPDPK